MRGGSITLDGKELAGLESYRRVKAGLGFVPQGRQIFSALSVEDNIRTGLETAKVKKIEEWVYTTFPILKEFRHRKGGNLSGGQQQQLAIARALVSGPKVLLLDEPTEGIQPNIIEEIGRVLQRLAGEGMAIVLVEQYLDFVQEIGHRFAIMDRGQIVAQGPTAELTGEVVGKWLSV
jgi:urea transport system ATP-binding protein